MRPYLTILLSFALFCAAAQRQPTRIKHHGNCPEGYEATPTKLLQNGSFDAGAVGFRTAYNYSVNDVYPEGNYAVAQSPSFVHPNFAHFSDHTSKKGKMLIVNGSTVLNQVVWQQTIQVAPDNIYLFSGWIRTVIDGTNTANLSIYINNKKALDVRGHYTTRDWLLFYRSWVSGKNSTTVTISIVNKNVTAGGNDFALDDLSICYCKPIFATLPQDPTFYAHAVLER